MTKSLHNAPSSTNSSPNGGNRQRTLHYATEIQFKGLLVKISLPAFPDVMELGDLSGPQAYYFHIRLQKQGKICNKREKRHAFCTREMQIYAHKL